MNKFMLGRKAGMTQIFDENAETIPVTVIDCGPLTVVQNKSQETDGYQAVKVGYEAFKKGNKPEKGQFAKAGVEPMRFLREFRDTDHFEIGQSINVADMFEVGNTVDVVGISKGKGYQGAVRRFGTARGPMAHGSKYHRHAGSNGTSATPSRVRKGNKLPGHLGQDRVTVQNLRIVKVDGERNILVVKGAVPGARGGLLEITTSVKSAQ